MMTATKAVKFKATFQESILGAVLQKVSRGGRAVDLHALPQSVVDYLQLTRANDSAPWKFDGDGFDALAACDGVKVRTRNDAPRQATVEFAVELAKPAIPIEELPREWNDGAHCGLTDWYEPLEAAITAALALGKGYAWTTGWYGSKKEIASACITQHGGQITVKASVSDDLDTEGMGEKTIRFTTNLEKIRDAITAAWEEAEENQKDNRAYIGFSVGRDGKWEHTLILPMGFGHDMDAPPGDYYHRWGWADEAEGVEHPAAIPAEVAKQIVTWAEQCEFGEQTVIGGWTVKAWE
jgi:hypothetical protein